MNTGHLRIALRADASAATGLGHIKRILALGLALRQLGAEVKLLARDLGVDVAATMASTGIGFEKLPAPSRAMTKADSPPYAHWAGVDWQQDAADTVRTLKAWQPDWIVVDHYSFDARWHRHVAEQLNARIAAIDDLADRDHAAAVLIDQNLADDHREKYRQRVQADTALLCGPRYALLAPAYASAPRVIPGDEVRSIGIFMGGIDLANLSAVALRACREVAGLGGPIEIVVTRAHPHIDELERLAARWPNTTIVSDLPDLAGFFGRHDLQIGAGGGAIWERCCLGAPTLALIAAANQQASLPGVAALGAVMLPTPATATDEKAVGEAVKSLLSSSERRRELSERSRELVDGLGAKRVGLKLAAETLQVHPAVIDDAQLMYSWRNDPATRRVSRSSDAIEWDAHVAWVRGVLENPRRFLLMARVGPTPVGVIRFDLHADDVAEVSLYLDPALHGLGLGRVLLLTGEQWLRARVGTVKTMTATVLEDNLGSRRLFESCGYRRQSHDWRKHLLDG